MSRNRFNDLRASEQHKAIVSVLGLRRKKTAEIYFSLGVSYQRHGAPKGVRISAPYEKLGREFWGAVRREVRLALCENGSPKEWVEDLISGDLRELVVAIITILVSTLSLPLSVAIPAAALIAKKGIRGLCSSRPEELGAPKAAELLAEREREWQRWKDRHR